MSDPTTPTPPATAKSARETIAEAHEAAHVVAEWNVAVPAEWARERTRLREALVPLRALLDAPPGSVERLCEAAEKCADATSDLCASVPLANGATGFSHAETHARSEIASEAADSLVTALAAVRASPEAVGAGASEAPSMAVTREVTALRRERDALKDERDAVKRERREMDGALEALTAERDALKADLAAAREFARVAESSRLGAEAELKRRDAEFREGWAKREALEKELAAARGEVERAKRFRDAALKLIRAVDDALSGRAEDPVGVDQRAALRYARDNLGIAFSWKGTPPPAIRVPCTANDCRWDTTDPSGRCAAHRDGWAEKVAPATPPPASEALTLPPLSDRVKWIAQYVKEHVRLDETSAENLAKEGAKILRICEKQAKETT